MAPAMFARAPPSRSQLRQGIVVPLGQPASDRAAARPIESAGPRWAVACDRSRRLEQAGAAGTHPWQHLSRRHLRHLLDPDRRQPGTCPDRRRDREDADLIADNIRALGYRVQDIRFILTSHEHYDHVGGIAKLAQLSGATVVTSAAAAKSFHSGIPATDDPQFGLAKRFPAGSGRPHRRRRRRSPHRQSHVDAMATPGHTPGALSWRWVSCDGGVCRTIVYADSLTAASADNYRFSDHPAEVTAFRASIAKIAASPCEILLTPHPSASQMPERLALGKPLLMATRARLTRRKRPRTLMKGWRRKLRNSPLPPVGEGWVRA